MKMGSISVNAYYELKSKKIKDKFVWEIDNFFTSGGFGMLFNIKKIGDMKRYVIKFGNYDSGSIYYEQKIYHELLKKKPNHINILPLITYGLDITVNNVKQDNIILPKMRYSLLDYDLQREHFSIFSIKIIRVLEYMNSLKLSHNDIKPENIVFNRGDEPYIIDFGLTRNFEKEKYQRKDENVLGSLSYMSLDLHNGIITQRSDLISFGLVLYLLLEQKELPWDYNNPKEYNSKTYFEDDNEVVVEEKKKFFENKDKSYFTNPLLIDYFNLINKRAFNQRPLYAKLYELFHF